MSRYRELEMPIDLRDRIRLIGEYDGSRAIVSHTSGAIMGGEIHVPKEPNSSHFMLVDWRPNGPRDHINYRDVTSLYVEMTVPHPEIPRTHTRAIRRTQETIQQQL